MLGATYKTQVKHADGRVEELVVRTTHICDCRTCGSSDAPTVICEIQDDVGGTLVRKNPRCREKNA